MTKEDLQKKVAAIRGQAADVFQKMTKKKKFIMDRDWRDKRNQAPRIEGKQALIDARLGVVGGGGACDWTDYGLDRSLYAEFRQSKKEQSDLRHVNALASGEQKAEAMNQKKKKKRGDSWRTRVRSYHSPLS